MQKHIENNSFTAKSRVKCLSPFLLDAAAPAPGGRVTIPPGPASPEPQSLTCPGDQRKEKTAAKGTRQQPQGTLPPPAQATHTHPLREQEPVIVHLLVQQLAERGLALYWRSCCLPPTAATRPSGRKRSTTALLSLRNTAAGCSAVTPLLSPVIAQERWCSQNTRQR